ncbi:2-amino-4-hydroxy-6-hydroxymethyldihydropteridine diphosphokinase [Erythrobacter alti]|uniref:2-amino-4-hydroxy-6- hydroxymethyldihydropteridine diphosphokinase n=1 Tax=Erythrobacter alti TaxID=1896145 RepID=UPI0030F487E8
MAESQGSQYLIALGSNQRHPGFGSPEAILRHAACSIGEILGDVLATSRIIRSAPVGPSTRQYANGALVVGSDLPPLNMLDGLQMIESQFGRRRVGRRWRARTLDLDIVLWSEGLFASPDLLIPHPMFRQRGFVLGPASEIAPDWRDPVTGLTLRQLRARLR